MRSPLLRRLALAAVTGAITTAAITTAAITTAAITTAVTAVVPAALPATLTGAASAAGSPGYWMVGADGAVLAFGTAGDHGAPPSLPPGRAATTVVPTPGGAGYWVAGADGAVAALGDANDHGSMAGEALNRPVVGMAATPGGGGYWLVGTDGGIFSFGDAAFHGSTGDIRLNQPIVGMASSPTGRGYWFVAADGGIFAFGDAAFHGSTGALRLNRPIVGMASSPTGDGYWLVASDGGIFAFGDAAFYGSTGDIRLNQPIVGMAPSPTGRGYWFVASDGGIFSYGDAGFAGSAGDRKLARPIVGMAGAPARPAPPATTLTTAPATTVTTAPAPGPGRQPFEIGLIGDTGYTTTSDDLLEFAIDDMNSRHLAFVVHDGDIMGLRPECEDRRYGKALEMMSRIQHPVVYTPGDNEWVDCTDRDARLAKLRAEFFATDQSLGGRTMTVARQAAPYVENQRWERGGVTFGTFHLVNTHDNVEYDPAEQSARRAATLAWLRETFAEAEQRGSAGVMLVNHANVFPSSCPSGAPKICFDEGTGDSKVYSDYLAEVYRLTADFAKPVVLVHGDTHIGRIDHPIGSPANFTRVETFQGPDSEFWMHVKVDAATPAVFEVAVQKAPKPVQ